MPMPKGRKHSEETKKKMSLQRIGNKYRLGIPHSEETKRKISEAGTGRKNTEATIIKMRESAKKGSDNKKWKGDNVSNKVLHVYVRKYLKEPKLCQICNLKPPYDLANITGLYNREFKNWKYLCRSCHRIVDGRFNPFKNISHEQHVEMGKKSAITRKLNLLKQGVQK